jgi:hypothetical protein
MRVAVNAYRRGPFSLRILTLVGDTLAGDALAGDAVAGDIYRGGHSSLSLPALVAVDIIPLRHWSR